MVDRPTSYSILPVSKNPESLHQDPVGMMKMTGTQHRWSMQIGLVLTLLATAVSAQPTSGSAGSDETELSFRKGSQLTYEEQSSQTRAYTGKMRQVETKTKILAEKAKKEKDIIKLNCVHDKLTNIQANISVAEGVQKAFQDPSIRTDDSKRNFEFSKITIAYQQVIVLEQEAEACIGEDLAYVGETRVDTSVDPSITDTDATDIPTDELDPVERSPVTTPWK